MKLETKEALYRKAGAYAREILEVCEMDEGPIVRAESIARALAAFNQREGDTLAVMFWEKVANSLPK